jgi:hypothetical protein
MPLYSSGGSACLNKKIVGGSILLLLVFAALTAPLATPQTDIGVSILQITPSSASAPAGSAVNIVGTIYSSGSGYQIVLGRTVVASGTAQGYYVNANFTVPELPTGTYSLILRDIAINVNSTNQFIVSTGYTVSAAQSSVQEGNSITLNVAVTGGQPGISYGAAVAVAVPSGTTYTATVNLGIPNLKGTASAQVTFPSGGFSPSGAATDYVGTYNVKFNDTLAQTTFSVNILDSLSYHRGETVTIRATGYQPNQATTITVTGGGTTLDTISVTASADGIINTNWVVSANAPIGDCTLKITPEGTQKAVLDQQTFTVIGYAVKVQVTNLSGGAVPDVSVQAADSTTGLVSTATSGADGVANFKLEKGPYGLTAAWNGVTVGETNITVTGDGTFTLRCQLADTIITVKNADGVAMPFVNLNIKYQYQSGSISKNGNFSGQTDPSGSFTLTSTLAGATYTIDASIYNQIFNALNNTFSNHIDQVASYVTIICPSKNVTLNIIGYNHEAIPNARIEFVELSNGLFYSTATDNAGTAAMQPTFGMYRVRVYSGNALINETSLQVFNDNHQQIRCTLYGIRLSVSVVDFFGSPIPNVNVILNGPAKTSAVTQSNGVATFDNIIGGNMQIIAEAQGTQAASQSITVNVNEPTTIRVKIDKYVSMGGMLMQASTLITVLIIIAAVLAFTTVEVYRRRRINSAHTITT